MKLALLTVSTLLCLSPLAASAQGETARDPAPIRTTPFPDVPETHWAYDAVEQLRKLGILRGYPPDSTLAPPARTGARVTPRPQRVRRRR